jgi:hypothetical protein
MLVVVVPASGKRVKIRPAFLKKKVTYRRGKKFHLFQINS